MMRLEQFFECLLSVNVYTLSRKMTAFKALEAFIVVLYCIHKKHAVEKIYYTEVFPWQYQMMKNVNIKFFDRFILAGYTICIGRYIVENIRRGIV